MNYTDAILGILSPSGGREQSAMTGYLSHQEQGTGAPIITIAPVVPLDNIIAPIDDGVHLGVTVTVTILVALLFLAVYVQLMMVLCFGYKLISYQTVLLFDILIWAALRLTLYSFYFRCCGLIQQLNTGWGWLLVAFPSALQYISLAILVHYFGENLFKVYERRQEMSSLVPPYKKMRKYRLLARLIWLASILIFIAGNITFYILIDNDQDNDLLVWLRVILLDGLFFIMGLLLGLCIILIYTTRAGKDIQEAQGVHKCWPLFISFLLILLFTSRTIYDLVAVKVEDAKRFGLAWTFATDMGDFEFEDPNNHYGYIAYLAVLVIWEVIPTYLIVIFFRVRMPSASVLIPKRDNTAPENRKHFFDNPRRYDDENEPLTNRSIKRSRMANGSTGQVSIPSLPDPSHLSGSMYGGYGSTSSRQNPYSAPSKYSVNNHVGSAMSNYMPGTTPPQLFTSPSFLSDR